jgi:hypothetical protein
VQNLANEAGSAFYFPTNDILENHHMTRTGIYERTLRNKLDSAYAKHMQNDEGAKTHKRTPRIKLGRQRFVSSKAAHPKSLRDFVAAMTKKGGVRALCGRAGMTGGYKRTLRNKLDSAYALHMQNDEGAKTKKRTLRIKLGRQRFVSSGAAHPKSRSYFVAAMTKKRGGCAGVRG